MKADHLITPILATGCLRQYQCEARQGTANALQQTRGPSHASMQNEGGIVGEDVEDMPYSLRRLTLEEMDRAAIIHRTAFDERLPWLAGMHTPEGDRVYFRERVFVECEVWGAAVDGETIGIVAFREGWIDQLYVLPQHQGRGAGDALLRIAKSAASSSLQLCTFQQNALARRFYEKRGFVAVKLTDGSESHEREPDVLYRWQQSEQPFERGE